MKLHIGHVLQWPPQPTTVLGLLVLGAGMILAPEFVWPMVATAAAALLLGDDEDIRFSA